MTERSDKNQHDQNRPGRRTTTSGDHEFLDLLSAMCESRATKADISRLESLLRSGPEYVERYVTYMDMHGMLHLLEIKTPAWAMPLVLDSAGTDPEIELLVNTESILALLEEDAEVEQRKAVERARIETLAAKKFVAFRQEQDRNRRPEPVAAPRNALYATVTSLVAAAIIGILFFIGRDAQPISVAKIVGANGLVWGNDVQAMPLGTGLQEGQLLDLKAGLLEIEFGDGARVILEGPAQFTVQSRGAGDLQIGKLVARVPSEAYGFLIHTPRMKIVDLGTEFGISVDQRQVSYLHVFEGRVSAASFDSDGKTIRQQMVSADQAVYLRPKTSAIDPAPIAVASRFARQLSPLPRYSTGFGLAAGDADPHWQVVASNYPDFVSQAAIVTNPDPKAIANDPRQAQWLSLTAINKHRPFDACYTFRMTFDLAESDIPRDPLRGSFRVDNLLTGLRVNGISIPVPKHGHLAFFEEAIPFVVDGSHLKAGKNRIEFDVSNDLHKKMAVATPLSLWVRWEGKH